MKNFSQRGFRIARSPFEVRLLYTFFLIFILIGFLSIAGYEFGHIGFGVSSVTEHYRGSESGLKFEKSFLQLVETTHFHSFVMGLVYLTLSHIFVATRLSHRKKGIFIIAAFVFTVLDILLPWAIRYVSASFSCLMIATWTGEWITYMGLILFPLYDMWLRDRFNKKADENLD